MEYTDIQKYVEDNNEPGLMQDEIDHVAMCLEHIYKWYHENRPLGSFLTAVVKNDFTGVVFQADAINSKALKIYAWFLTWNLPADWRSKAKAEGK